MGKINENPLKEYKNGLPCMFGDVVGRIVGEGDGGSWGLINDVEIYSIPLFGTPHGSIIKTGVLYLSEMSDDGMVKLLEFENDVKTKGDELYFGKLNDIIL